MFQNVAIPHNESKCIFTHIPNFRSCNCFCSTQTGTMHRNIRSTLTGSDSWDRYDRTPPRGRPDVAARAKFNEELLDMSVIMHDLAVDRNTRTGPLKYAGCTPKNVIKRQKEADKKRKLLEANEANDRTPNMAPRQKRLRFEGKCRW